MGQSALWEARAGSLSCCTLATGASCEHEETTKLHNTPSINFRIALPLFTHLSSVSCYQRPPRSERCGVCVIAVNRWRYDHCIRIHPVHQFRQGAGNVFSVYGVDGQVSPRSGFGKLIGHSISLCRHKSPNIKGVVEMRAVIPGVVGLFIIWRCGVRQYRINVLCHCITPP